MTEKVVLRCPNTDCESYETDERLFTIQCTVDEDRCVAESLGEVEANYFECCFCGDRAVDRPLVNEETDKLFASLRED